MQKESACYDGYVHSSKLMTMRFKILTLCVLLLMISITFLIFPPSLLVS